MMDPRTLELLKEPEQILEGDLLVLEEEIQKFPYVQSLRALYLKATHLYKKEAYNDALSKASAYTTDKKILFQFINGYSEPTEIVDQVKEQDSQENIGETTNAFQKVQPEEVSYPEKVFVGGEINRILFPGEEDFLSNQVEKIDWQQTEESGALVTYSMEENTSQSSLSGDGPKTDSVDTEVESTAELAEGFSEEEVPLNFHSVENYLPQIQPEIQKHVESYTPPKAKNSHEEEMQRLIAEVEAKMKKNKTQQSISKIVEEEAESSEINFVAHQPFLDSNSKGMETPANTQSEIPEEQDLQTDPKTSWVPLQVDSPSLDSQIGQVTSGRKEAGFHLETENKVEENEPIDVEPRNEEAFEGKETNEPSNVPVFISTWQNWLKIDRTSQGEPQKTQLLSIDQIKNRAIEKFIETEPKISKLKEEPVQVKEKPDDISHLMTETLAGLYLEQRLYTKAINAFEVLIGKHPERKEYFEEKIESIKQIRTGK